MQAVGKKNRNSLHSLYDFVLMTRGTLLRIFQSLQYLQHIFRQKGVAGIFFRTYFGE